MGDGELERLRAEVERLTRERDEARAALDGLRSMAFMRGKPDGEVVEHIKSVVESYVRADQRAESDRAAMLTACKAAHEYLTRYALMTVEERLAVYPLVRDAVARERGPMTMEEET